MSTIIYIILFLICIVFYIHIIYQLKTSNEENIYEVDYLNKSNLEEVCDLRQPFILQLDNPVHLTKEDISSVGEKLNIIKSREIVMKEDDKEKTTKKIYSEYNKKLVNNEHILQKMALFDTIVKPDFSIFNHHDLIISDDNFNTPLVSNYNYRNYLCICEGNMKLRLASHKYAEIFKPKLDYELLQNISTYDIMKNNKDIKVIELDVKTNDVIYIPPKWWYSLQFIEPGVVLKYQYRTPMNIIAHIPNYLYSYMAVSKANEKRKRDKMKKYKEN